MSEEIEFQEPITDFPLDPGQALPPPSRSNHTFKQNRNTPWRKVKVCKIITLIRGYENTLLRKVIVFKKHNFILILTHSPGWRTKFWSRTSDWSQKWKKLSSTSSGKENSQSVRLHCKLSDNFQSVRFHCKLSENSQSVRFHCKDDEKQKSESNNYADIYFPDETEE